MVRRVAEASESALNLVRLMREDEAVLSVVRQAAAKDPVKSRCFGRLQPASLTGPLGSAIMVEMSAKEIDEAARFFQTDVGRKFTEFNLAQVRKGVEPPLDAFAEQFSLAEMKVLTDFAKGSAGRQGADEEDQRTPRRSSGAVRL